MSGSERKRFDLAVGRAIRQGRDLGEYLDKYGLLVTTERSYRMFASTLEHAAAQLDAVTLSDIVGPRYHTGNYSAQDIVSGVQRKLLELAEQYREEGKKQQ